MTLDELKKAMGEEINEVRSHVAQRLGELKQQLDALERRHSGVADESGHAVEALERKVRELEERVKKLEEGKRKRALSAASLNPPPGLGR
ncbi:MAG TPA: hypothetical protein VHY79_10090 [Rhizomicrobium sp.]|jgi:polyhydroxyalkanoate synthesis regulator phasin|nr:hypothetical protein [Rhizomicrobium sp.]